MKNFTKNSQSNHMPDPTDLVFPAIPKQLCFEWNLPPVPPPTDKLTESILQELFKEEPVNDNLVAIPWVARALVLQNTSRPFSSIQLELAQGLVTETLRWAPSYPDPQDPPNIHAVMSIMGCYCAPWLEVALYVHVLAAITHRTAFGTWPGLWRGPETHRPHLEGEPMP
jgi:hypothetical protein